MQENRSLKKDTQRLVVGLLCLISLVFLILTVIISRNMNLNYQIRTAETAVHNAEATINSGLINYNYLTRLMMIDDRILTYLRADTVNANMIYEARWGIYSIQNLYSYIDSVFLFRNDGQSVSTEQSPYEVVLTGPEYERVMAAKGSTVVSLNGNGMVHKATGETMLTLSRAIYDMDTQKLIGFLIMSVAGSSFESSLVNQMDEPVCIVDNRGTLLCGDEELYRLYNPNSTPDSEGLITSVVRLDGKFKVLAGSSDTEPFTILCVSGKTSKFMSASILIGLAFTLLAFVGAILVWRHYVSKNIIVPVENLRDAMEKTKSVGWMESIDAEMPPNEIGTLADNYNSMIAYLNELFRKQRENEQNIRKAEMRVLQEQIKPHFLYNTLETISYLSVEEQAPKVHDALEHLGNFYRNFLSKGEREIPLGRELRITQDYLALQLLRYGDAFSVEYDVEEETLDRVIPKLILQPLVENAIYHGVRPKGEHGLIRISAKRDAGDLVISVYDSGVGMEEEQIREVLCDTTYGEEGSFGLAGTINRIRYFCNNPEVVRIRSEYGEFTEVEIRIPKTEEKTEG